MNLLLLSLRYPNDLMAEAARNSKDGLQMQINSFQNALIGGLLGGMRPDESLRQLNALPVGDFPTRYRKLLLKSFTHNGIRELGCLNLPWFKQRMRAQNAYRAIVDWARESEQNRTVLIYTLYLPYMQAVVRAKQDYPDLKAAVIVTDLPNELGIDSWRRGLMKKAERIIGKQRTRVCKAMDGFVLLTKHMAEALPVGDKPRVVVEGLVSGQAEPPQAGAAEPPRFTVLYTGTLNRELGIGALLEAFEGLADCDLWLCGLGDMSEEAEKATASHSNIHSFGFVPQAKALELQSKACALINPRMPEGKYTRYSFPSKTLEYLRAGKPVLCYKLEGIPDDYDPYLCYIEKPSADGIAEAVRALRERPCDERRAMGEKGREFALSCKNADRQCERILSLLRSL